tara:strand:+ start:356 stop:607 length:252 start_codon:yes stop_codon:yes gene_type:complete
MKIGDLIRYRGRKPTDPHPGVVGNLGTWKTLGVVVRFTKAAYDITGEMFPSVEYVDFNGDHIICKCEDVEVINEKRVQSKNNL